MKKTILLLIAVLATATAQDQPQRVERQIADLKMGGGSISLAVIEEEGKPKVIKMHVCDEHIIESVLFLRTASGMKEFQAALAKAIEAAEK